VQKIISDYFEPLARKTECNWTINGASSYKLCDIDETGLLEALIRGAPTSQKDFYVLDIGAGNFQCASHLAAFVNSLKGLAPDITIHIISTRAEGDESTDPKKEISPRAVVIKSGRCIQYNCINFNVEKCSTELDKLGMHIEGRVDLALSRWCLRHLADPTGAFSQVFNLLRPQTGTFIFDGFFLLHEGDSCKSYLDSEMPNSHMVQLMLDTGAPFLMQPWSDGRSLNRFVLKRPDDMCCPLPMKYEGIEYSSEDLQNHAEHITRFKRTEETIPWHIDPAVLETPRVKDMIGSQSLFIWLEEHRLLDRSSFHLRHRRWVPIECADIPRSAPSSSSSSSKTNHEGRISGESPD
jgi:SAM-dependent methyltransferase